MTANLRVALPVLLLAGLLAACGSPAPAGDSSPAESAQPAEVEPTDEPEPTAEPTATTAPTATAVPPPEPTALPEGVLFRDEFDGQLADGWQWQNEDPTRHRMTIDGWLEITGGDIGFFQTEAGLINFLNRDLPDGQFEIITRIQAEPSENFHQATIYIYEDPANYIALNTGYCDLCPTGGHGFFMETIIDNNPFGDVYALPRAAEDTDVYLRLVNDGESVTGYYATTPGEWQRAGAFGNFFDFNSVGIGVTNSNPAGVSEDIIARFDFFEIRRPGTVSDADTASEAEPPAVAFRDDFADGLDDAWTVTNEDMDRWSVGPGGITFTAGNPPFASGEGTNYITRPLPEGVDISAMTHVLTAPAENFEQASLFLFNDAGDYVAVLSGFCQPCLPDTGGYGFFMEAFANEVDLLAEQGSPFIPRQAEQTDVYLMLEYSPENSVAVGFYATVEGDWQQAFIVRDLPPLTHIGFGAANLPGPDGSTVDLEATYEYVEVITYN